MCKEKCLNTLNWKSYMHGQSILRVIKYKVSNLEVFSCDASCVIVTRVPKRFGMPQNSSLSLKTKMPYTNFVGNGINNRKLAFKLMFHSKHTLYREYNICTRVTNDTKCSFATFRDWVISLLFLLFELQDT